MKKKFLKVIITEELPDGIICEIPALAPRNLGINCIKRKCEIISRQKHEKN